MAVRLGERLGTLLRGAIGAKPGELSACLAALAYIFLLFAAYAILRPVRDAMGIEGGDEDLPLLFVGTFLVMLAAVPAYGWLCSRYPRGVFLPWVYLFFVLNLLGFYAVFAADPGNVIAAWAFFIWLSVFNLFVVSVFWSFMADVFSRDQAKRLFGFLAAGASAGFIVGPAFTAGYAELLGTSNLILISAFLLALPILLIRYLLVWSARSEASKDYVAGAAPPAGGQAMGGNPFAGFTIFFRSPYLLTLGLFFVLYTSISTFIYLQQADLVSNAFASSEDRTRVFALIDLAVNVLSIGTQLFLTGRIVRTVGMVVALAALPVAMVGGFLLLAAAPTLGVLIAVQIFRRAGNYAITRPAREMLYTVLDQESKYKAKNVIDTVVYRGGDALNGGFFALLKYFGMAMTGTALVGAVVAALWAACAITLGRWYQKVPEGAGPNY